MAKRLLTEVQHPYILKPIKHGLVENAKTGKKDFVVFGIFGKVDAVNENKRLYPKTEIERNLLENSAFKSRLKSRSVLGELEHPTQESSGLKTATHVITDVWLEDLDAGKIQKYGYSTEAVKPGTYIMGRMEIFEEGEGSKKLREYFEKGINVGVSSRGRGETQMESNGVERVYNYDLETFDAVSLPSVVEARPKPVSEAVGLAEPGVDTPPNIGSEPPPAPDSGPDLGGGSPLDAPAPSPAPGDEIDNWKEEAAELVRAITQVASEDDPDLKDMIELLSKCVGSVEVLAEKDDPEAQKYKGEILAIAKILSTRAMSLATGKKLDSYEKKEDNDEDISDKKKNKKESVQEAVELKDGQIIELPISYLQDYSGHNVIGEWLKRQTTKTTPAMVYSRGSAGVLMKLVDPIVQVYDVFVGWDKMNGIKTIENKESKTETNNKNDFLTESVIDKEGKVKIEGRNYDADNLPLGFYVAIKPIYLRGFNFDKSEKPNAYKIIGKHVYVQDEHFLYVLTPKLDTPIIGGGYPSRPGVNIPQEYQKLPVWFLSNSDYLMCASNKQDVLQTELSFGSYYSDYRESYIIDNKMETKDKNGGKTMNSIELIKKLTDEIKSLKEGNKKLSEQTKVNPEDMVSKKRYEASKKVINNISKRLRVVEKKRLAAVKLVKESQEKLEEQKQVPSLRSRIKERIFEETAKKGSIRREDMDESSRERAKRLVERVVDTPLAKKEALAESKPNVMTALVKRMSQK